MSKTILAAIFVFITLATANCATVQPDYTTRHGIDVFLQQGAQLPQDELEELTEQVITQAVGERVGYVRSYVDAAIGNLTLEVGTAPFACNVCLNDDGSHCERDDCNGSFKPGYMWIGAWLKPGDCIAASAIAHEMGHAIRNYAAQFGDLDWNHDDAAYWGSMREADWKTCESVCGLCQP